ncbi:MAG TPA: FGLLP motif-containing membrane protein [Candidatus Limnocylindrales bacterium]
MPSRARRRGGLALTAVGLALIALLGAAPAVGPPTRSAAAAVLIVKPDHGRATAPFDVHYGAPGAQCDGQPVILRWDGAQIADGTLDQACSAAWQIIRAPSNTVGSHTLEACIPAQSACAWPARAVYTIDPPPPRLGLRPTRGLATRDVDATYTNPLCGRAKRATFFWDNGQELLDRVAFDASCRAVLTFRPPAGTDPGRYVVMAGVCEPACDPATVAKANYVVLAPATPPPTPTPTPVRATPTATPTPTPSPTLTPTPTPTPSPTPTPTPMPTPTPTATAAASPTPTGEVLGETGGPSRPGGTPRGNPFLPSLASSLGALERPPLDGDVLITNLIATIVFVFLFGLTAEVFNGTLDANRAEVEGWWRRLARGPLRFLGPILRVDTALDRLGESGRRGLVVHGLLVLALVGVIYGFLSPDFGLNASSLVLFASLVLGLGLVTYWTEGSASALGARRYKARASVRVYGTAVLVAIVSVAASRVIAFSPGLIYGFVASAVVITPAALAKRDDALLVLLPAAGLLAICLAAWALLGPVAGLAANGGWEAALLEAVLAIVLVAGLETLVFTMIPLRFMDGAVVMRWSRPAWVLVFGTVTFLWWQLLLNQNAAYAAAFRQTSVQLVLGMLLLFMLTTGAFWGYFRFRSAPAAPVEDSATS